MGWIEDCAWLKDNLSRIATEDLPGFVGACESYRRELAALAEIVPQIEADARRSLEHLSGALDAWRQEVDPRDDALRQAAGTIAEAVEQVLAGLTQVKASLAEDAAGAARDFDRLAAVVSHAGGELSNRRTEAASALTEASVMFKGIGDRLVQTGASATAAAKGIRDQIKPVYEASERAVTKVTSRMAGIEQAAPHQFKTTEANAMAPPVALQASAGEALDRLAIEAEALVSRLEASPRQAGDALDEAAAGLECNASGLYALLLQAVMASSTAREATTPAAQGVGEERAALRELADAVRAAAVLVSTDWAAIVRP